MNPQLDQLIDAILPEVEAVRHDLHRHPELGYGVAQK
jgi:metal-dependent amidase/aminoacylase/carboxypeptidase family protein